MFTRLLTRIVVPAAVLLWLPTLLPLESREVRGEMILDYSALTGVTVNARNQVIQWDDNATGHNATVVAGAEGPDYVMASISPTAIRPVLRFDGTNDLLGATAPVPSSGSMFLAFNKRGIIDDRLVGWEDSNVGKHGIGIQPNHGNRPNIIARQNFRVADLWGNGPAVRTTYEVWGFSWGSTGVHLYRKAYGGSGTWDDNATAVSVTSGRIPLRIGGPGTGSRPRFNGDLAALRVYDTQMNAEAMEDEVGRLYTVYFVPEPNSLCLLCLGGIIGLLIVSNDRQRKWVAIIATRV